MLRYKETQFRDILREFQKEFLLNPYNQYTKNKRLDEIKLCLPGIGKENITVESVKNDTVKVTWTVKSGQDETDAERIYKVVPHKDATAEYTDGVLKVKLEPLEQQSKKIIEIK